MLCCCPSAAVLSSVKLKYCRLQTIDCKAYAGSQNKLRKANTCGSAFHPCQNMQAINVCIHAHTSRDMLSLAYRSKHSGIQCVHTCTHMQGHAQPPINTSTSRHTLTSWYWLAHADICSDLNTCSLLLIQANINSSLDMNKERIYYWSKRKRRNYSRYNRYQKCCVRKLWDQLLNIYNCYIHTC